MDEIFSFGDYVILADIIGGVSAIFGASDFEDLIKIGLVLAVLTAAVQSLRAKAMTFDFSGVFFGWLIYAALFMPTTTVTVSNVYTLQSTTVDEVPIGVAAPGAFLSRVGLFLTETFETAYSAPAMTGEGFGGALEVLKRIRYNSYSVFALGDSNSPIAGDDYWFSWRSYIQKCVLPAMDMGHIERSTLFNVGNLMDQIGTNNALATQIKLNGSGEIIVDCDDAYDTLTTYTDLTFLPEFKAELASSIGLPAGTPEEVTDKVQDALDTLGLTATADDFLTTAILLPTYYEAAAGRHSTLRQFSNATAINDAIRARNAQWLGEQSLFEQYVRPMLVFVESLMFAISPAVAILIVIGITGISFLTKYLGMLLWIYMWMPMLSIVNMIQHYALSGELVDLEANGQSVTSLAGYLVTQNLATEYLATGGMLAASVPILSAMIVFGSVYGVVSMAQRIGGPDTFQEDQATPRTFGPMPILGTTSPLQHTPQGGTSVTGSEQLHGSVTLGQMAATHARSAADAARREGAEFTSMLGQRVDSLHEVGESGSQQGVFNLGANFQGSQTLATVQRYGASIMNKTEGSETLTAAETYTAALAAQLGNKNFPLTGNISGSAEGQSRDVRQTQSELTNNLSQELNKNTEFQRALSSAVAADLRDSHEQSGIFRESLSSDAALRKEANDTISATQSFERANSFASDVGTSRSYSMHEIANALVKNPGPYVIGEMSQLDTMMYSNNMNNAADQMAQFIGPQFPGDPEKAHAVAKVMTGLGQNPFQREEVPQNLQDQTMSIVASAIGVQLGANRSDAFENAGVADQLPEQIDQIKSAREDLTDEHAPRIKAESEARRSNAATPVLEGTSPTEAVLPVQQAIDDKYAGAARGISTESLRGFAASEKPIVDELLNRDPLLSASGDIATMLPKTESGRAEVKNERYQAAQDVALPPSATSLFQIYGARPDIADPNEFVGDRRAEIPAPGVDPEYDQARQIESQIRQDYPIMGENIVNRLKATRVETTPDAIDDITAVKHYMNMEDKLK